MKVFDILYDDGRKNASFIIVMSVLIVFEQRLPMLWFLYLQ